MLSGLWTGHRLEWLHPALVPTRPQHGQSQPKLGVYSHRLLSSDITELRPSPFTTQLSLTRNDCPTHFSLAPFLLLVLQVPRAMLTQVQVVTFPAAQTSDQKMLPSASQGGGNEELFFREQHF